METIDNYKFHVPFTMTVVGASGSGKTYFVRDFIKNREYFVDKNWDNCVYIWKFEQQNIKNEFKNIFKKITFVLLKKDEPFPNITKLSSGGNETLIILDDCMTYAIKNYEVNTLFCEGRHANITTIFLSQNLFAQGHYARNIRINSNYLVIFRNMHDENQICDFIRRHNRENYEDILRFYKNATIKDYGYLLFDLRLPPWGFDNLRYRSDLKQHSQIIYKIKNIDLNEKKLRISTVFDDKYVYKSCTSTDNNQINCVANQYRSGKMSSFINNLQKIKKYKTKAQRKKYLSCPKGAGLIKDFQSGCGILKKQGGLLPTAFRKKLRKNRTKINKIASSKKFAEKTLLNGGSFLSDIWRGVKDLIGLGVNIQNKAIKSSKNRSKK